MTAYPHSTIPNEQTAIETAPPDTLQWPHNLTDEEFTAQIADLNAQWLWRALYNIGSDGREQESEGDHGCPS